jgi:hypothetical protein
MEKFTAGYYLERSGFAVIHVKPGKLNSDNRITINYRVEASAKSKPDFEEKLTEMIADLESVFLRQGYKMSRVQKSGLDKYRGTLTVILPFIQTEMFGGTEVIV